MQLRLIKSEVDVTARWRVRLFAVARFRLRMSYFLIAAAARKALLDRSLDE